MSWHTGRELCDDKEEALVCGLWTRLCEMQLASGASVSGSFTCNQTEAPQVMTMVAS